MNHEACVRVNVATLWSTSESARDVDRPVIVSSPAISEWLNALSHEARAALSSQNLVQSQALLGQTVQVIEEKGDWAQVVILDQPSSKDPRGYPGWMPKAQLSNQMPPKEGAIAIVKTPLCPLYDDHKQLEMLASYETYLPIVAVEKALVRVWTPNGERYLHASDVETYTYDEGVPQKGGDQIVECAELFLNLPYLWGGMSGFGFDCSGFSYTMCRANGYRIPRDAHDQADHGKRVSMEELEPGDLLFFSHNADKKRIHHVGIYYGDGCMIHAPNTGKAVEIISLEGTVYAKEFCLARRYH
ncbi:gamma-D-glutamyl-L-lysine endopeptidase [Pullulanibacillus camelliae]|uniref:Gamma-D-glutamyl-L-lysine endopeptidase n=1 Tax=Pullulanibacillus camelliae TaxID=1707096 RepID=A0A8J2YCX2_9BACL|nr:C40 family peptidase [Pullulanibacillus camelliae]GGE32069.1 gamma-D-glutamyl-L-lysine endopeptidase [Pullulanibacillus camelliae]